MSTTGPELDRFEVLLLWPGWSCPTHRRAELERFELAPRPELELSDARASWPELELSDTRTSRPELEVSHPGPLGTRVKEPRT